MLKLYEELKVFSAFGPQGILNLFFYKKWQKLSVIYNVFPYYWNKFYKMKTENIDGVLLHFAGETPWKKPHDINNPFYCEF